MNILLLGSSGQVGKAWIELSKTSQWPKGFQLTAWDRNQADLSGPESLLEKIGELQSRNKIDVIINAAAYTQVDRAEEDRKLCRTINAQAPAMIADFCVDEKILFIHYSTDYVYSGQGTDPLSEEEELDAKNFYGLCKAEGDSAIEMSGARFLIFRTSWVYSHQGKNFVLSMLKLGSEREQLKIVNDQFGAPTYAPDLAQHCLSALKKSLVMETVTGVFPSGVYHLCNSGSCSWFEFAQEIFKCARNQGIELKVKEVSPITTSEYPTAAKRPGNSRLSLDKIGNDFQIFPRPWQEALMDCFQQLKGNIK